MKHILFIGPCYKFEDVTEGQIQRIKAVDDLFRTEKRTYLRLSFKQYILPQFKKSTEDKLFYCKANILTCWPLVIYYILTCRFVYAHTIYNLSRLLLFSPFLGRKKIVLDVHGAVPEEQELIGNITLSKKYEQIERRCFNKTTMAIHVTESMRSHFKKKYPGSNRRDIVYGIYPSNLKHLYGNNHASSLAEKKTRGELGIPEDSTVFIYSGGAHKWQNIDEMLYLIKDNQHKNYRFIILSGEKHEIITKLDLLNIDKSNMIIASVSPAELRHYYQISNYGFVLRNDDIVNRVACPTKLIEYLYYGIIPIVKSPDIGDFMNYGYEFLSQEEVTAFLKPRKSEINVRVVQEILHTHNNSDWVEELCKNNP